MDDKRANKKVNYFTGLLLNESDFKDEQQYHVDSLRSHNKNLHRWGIAHGLNVERTGTKNVTVSMGMAIDKSGNQISLLQLKEIDLSASTAVNLYLTISYNEIKTDLREGEGEKEYTRILEDAVIEYDPNKPDDPSMKIILARLIFDRKKDELVSVDLDERTYSKTLGGDIEAKKYSFFIESKNRCS